MRLGYTEAMTRALPMIDQGRLRELAETMFATNERGRLIGCAPHLHLIRTPESIICRCHADVDDAAACALNELARRPRGRPRDWVHDYADYIKTLSLVAPLKGLRAGSLYSFPELQELGDAAIAIDENNAELLLGGLEEWLPDVAADLPMIAMVADGRAVSVCASVNSSRSAHCAGVETLPAYRGKGFATHVVASWAISVRAAGAEPFYATTFDNHASQGVATHLGLILLGSEFSIECETR